MDKKKSISYRTIMLAKEVRDAVNKYEEDLDLPNILGVLELAKIEVVERKERRRNYYAEELKTINSKN